MAVWRSLTAGDIDGLVRVADQIHPGLPESAEVFAERARLYPDGCLALIDEDDGDQICGYAISHPIRHAQPPALDTLLGTISPDADTYYIHDVAILPRLRGRGLAEEAISRLLGVAARYPTTSLVSVYGTQSFWGRFGFVPEAVDGALRDKLSSYGENSQYLSRSNHQRDALSGRR